MVDDWGASFTGERLPLPVRDFSFVAGRCGRWTQPKLTITKFADLSASTSLSKQVITFDRITPGVIIIVMIKSFADKETEKIFDANSRGNYLLIFNALLAENLRC